MADLATPLESAVAAPIARQPWQLPDPAGQLASGYEPSMDDNQLVDVLRRMLLSRHVDERGVSLQRQGRLGTFSTTTGQEASVLGSALALDHGTDWIVPQYRELPAMLVHGYPLERFFRYFRGDPLGNQMPDGANILTFQISPAAQIPHAVGLAWGLAHQGHPAVVTVYFGDGASSEASLAIEMIATVEDVAAATIHPHRTLSETLGEAASILAGYPIHVQGVPR